MIITVLMVQNIYIKWLACRSDCFGGKTDPQAKAKGISILLVDAALDGVKKVALYKNRAACPRYSRTIFDDVYVPATQRLGKKDKALLI